MKAFISLLLLILVFSCSTPSKKTEPNKEAVPAKTAYKLELVWESDTVVRTPESVLLDRENGILYVACINEGPWVKDGNGFISKMNLQGNVTDLKWVEGLSAPKGMGISGGSLFVNDIDEFVEIDIETGVIKNKIKIDGKPDLNDITVADDGTVFTSGSGSVTIYKLADGELVPLQTGTDGERYNGLHWEKERMLLLTSASSQFKEVNLETGEVKIIAEEMGHGDGIAPVGDGGYITTSWKGQVYYVSAEGEKTKLLDTEADGINAADIDFLIGRNLLFVPTFYGNQVKAYKLVK